MQQQLHLIPVKCRRIHPAVCLCQHMAEIEHSIPTALPAPIAYNQTKLVSHGCIAWQHVCKSMVPWIRQRSDFVQACSEPHTACL